MNPTSSPDAVDTATAIIVLLTVERRVEVNITIPDRDDGSAPLLEAVTINREQGRLLGSGGKTVKDLRILMRHLIDGAGFLVKLPDDSVSKNTDVQFISTDKLLRDYISLCAATNGTRVEATAEATILTPPPGSNIDGELKLAIERVFFAISRAQGERLPIRWN